MSDRDDFGAFLVGFIVGGLTGAVSALLFAPQSGDETRTLIKDKAIELRDQTSETVSETLEKAEAYAKDAVTKAEKLLEEAKKKYPYNYPITCSSDAHYPVDIGKRYTSFLLQDGNVTEIKKALKNEDGRKLIH